MPSKSVGGFDLVLGHLYNDFWFNRASPQHNAEMCTKCDGLVTHHRLEKVILAFGKLIIKECDVLTCPVCLHEEVIMLTPKPKKKATKKNLVSLFSKLPKSVQQSLLLGGK